MPAQKTTKDSALSKVQNLYLIQVELWNFLDTNAVDAEVTKNIKKKLSEFQDLLSQVDPQYMGGEDVFETLQWIPGEVKKKLKTTKPATRKKAVATAKKVTAKKPVAKKAVRKKKK